MPKPALSASRIATALNIFKGKIAEFSGRSLADAKRGESESRCTMRIEAAAEVFHFLISSTRIESDKQIRELADECQRIAINAQCGIGDLMYPISPECRIRLYGKLQELASREVTERLKSSFGSASKTGTSPLSTPWTVIEAGKGHKYKSLRDLAKKAGISYSSLKRVMYEGHNMKVENRAALALVLDCHPDDLSWPTTETLGSKKSPL